MDIQIFKNEEINAHIRGLMIDGEPWFVAADVCKALDIKNASDALNRLDDDEKGVGSIYTPGCRQNMSIVNEYGLYNLILGSRKPEARAFKRWITHEVLPSLRKTGSYSIKENREELIARALIASQSVIDELKQRVEVMEPKAEVYDKIIETENLIPWRTACKLIRWTTGTIIKENKLREFLLHEDWIYQKSYGKYEPRASAIDDGFMSIKMEPCKDGVLRQCNCFTVRGIQNVMERLSPKSRSDI